MFEMHEMNDLFLLVPLALVEIVDGGDWLELVGGCDAGFSSASKIL